MVDSTKEKINLDDRIVGLFEGNLRRIFAMKVTPSTFREIQNVILSCANQNKEMANLLFEILLAGQIPAGLSLTDKHKKVLEDVIKDFTIPARLAKDVFERGEFINIITSDLISQKDQYIFLNRLRRIDGDEFVFMSDPQNTINLVQHLIGRLCELGDSPKGKEEILKFKKELKVSAERLQQLSL